MVVFGGDRGWVGGMPALKTGLGFRFCGFGGYAFAEGGGEVKIAHELWSRRARRRGANEASGGEAACGPGLWCCGGSLTGDAPESSDCAHRRGTGEHCW